MQPIDGCETKYATPVPEEKVCPVCGQKVEVFTKGGKIVEDTACPCGYVFKAEEVLSIKTEKKDE